MRKIMLFCLGIIFIISGLVSAMEYNEAPQFHDQVEKGLLPPVEERLPIPEDVYIVKPSEKIGTYGGTVRTATLMPEQYGDDTMLSSFVDPIKTTADLSGMKPHVVKQLTNSEDMKEWTFFLRKGLKWSDGEPFTADDFVFWYEDVIKNKELTPAIGEPWQINNELAEIKKIDDFTVKYIFPKPQPFFRNYLIHRGPWDLYFPKHYLKNFHPAYRNKEELTQEAKSAGFDAWYEYFWDKNSTVWGMPLNKDLPTLTGYVLDEKTTDRRVWKANPYFWKVDTEGNQLPYLEKIEAVIVSDVEVVQGMIMSGEVDFAGLNADIRNYPMYKKYEEQGNYRTVMWKNAMGSEVVYMVNLTHEDPVLRKIFQDVRFRRALSLGMDREEINNSIYFGKAEPVQYTVLSSSKYYKPEYAKAYTEYDPEKANQLLDEMGLKKDSEGYRLRPDGKRLTFTIEFFDSETPKAANIELVSAFWRDLGLDVRSKSVSGELQTQRAPANLMDATVWHGDKASDVLFPAWNNLVIPYAPRWDATIWPLWGQWFATKGSEGEEPPAEIKKIRQWYEDMLVEPDADKRIELGRKILVAQAENLWCIGTVGRAPYPIIVSKKIHNFPTSGLWGWDSLYSMNRSPEQIFIEK